MENGGAILFVFSKVVGKVFWERHLSIEGKALRVQASRYLKSVSGKGNSRCKGPNTERKDAWNV